MNDESQESEDWTDSLIPTSNQWPQNYQPLIHHLDGPLEIDNHLIDWYPIFHMVDLLRELTLKEGEV